ncbi:MAG TPA: hypothetical protein VFD43_10275, partial [Planctomycetota bacterium]|nr:hypothetical protein [Planctomycetota bacterium]
MAAALALATPGSLSAQDAPVALVGARILPVAGPEIEEGVLVLEGGRIVAVGPGLAAAEAEVIDASGMIVMPGFVDTHRHIWEGLLRNIGTDVPLEGRAGYISFVL